MMIGRSKCWSTSVYQEYIHLACFPLSLALTYSASPVEVETRLCVIDLHETGPPEDIGISRGQAKPRGSWVRVPAGTGAGRPGDTPDPCIPATPVAVFFFTVQLSRLQACTTPTTPLFGEDDSHEGPRRPTAANEGRRRGKRAQTTPDASFGS